MNRSRKTYSALIASMVAMSLCTSNVYALEITVSGNGSESTSSVTTQQTQTVQVVQDNQADVNNNVDAQATTGGNEVNDNTGGSTSLETGDVDIKADIENSANTSVVASNCCQGQADSVTVSGNGSDSNNQVTTSSIGGTTINVDQNANINNNVNINADTGNNEASDNTGNTSIDTGNITVKGIVNNGPVNTSSVSVAAGPAGTDIKITGNGSGSDNIVRIDNNYDQSVSVDNNANINNVVDFYLNTGKNTASGNNGDVSISTGNIILDFFLNNGPVNTNIVEIDCCGQADPDDRPDDGDKDNGDDEEDGDDNGGNGEDKNGDGDGDNGGELLAEAASDEAVGGNGAILGLSDTSSGTGIDYLFWFGLLGLALGFKFIGEELTTKHSLALSQ